MNGTSVISYVVLGKAAAAYDLAVTGDFNRDGKQDILRRHVPSGEV